MTNDGVGELRSDSPGLREQEADGETTVLRVAFVEVTGGLNGAGQAAAAGAPCSAMAFATTLMDRERGSGLRGAAGDEPMESELSRSMAGALHVEVRHHRGDAKVAGGWGRS